MHRRFVTTAYHTTMAKKNHHVNLIEFTVAMQYKLHDSNNEIKYK